MGLHKILLLWYPVTVRSCSHVTVPAADGSTIIGRTMELGGSGGELLGFTASSSPDDGPAYTVTVHPRGATYSHSLCKGTNAFTVQRGFVSVDSKVPLLPGSHFDNVSADGMNEDGLTISAHTLRQSLYQDEASPSQMTPDSGSKLCFGDLVPWALANFRTVKDLADGLRNTTVVADTIAPLPSGDRLHWAAEDSEGGHIVIEYLEGKLNVHQNTVGVMTNDPDYTWHLRNLNNYVPVSALNPKPDAIAVQTEVGMTPSVVGHGFNLVGLPGDISPPSRFVRLFYKKALTLKNRGKPPTTPEGIRVVMGLLNDVWITKGTVALGQGDLPGQFEFTQYSLIKIPEKRLFHWRSYNNAQWRVVDLSKLNFNVSSATPLDDGSDGILDVTARLTPGKPSSDMVV